MQNLVKIKEGELAGYSIDKTEDGTIIIYPPNKMGYKIMEAGESIKCTCQGYIHRGKCKHAEYVKNLKIEKKIPKADALKILGEFMENIKADEVLEKWETAGSTRRKQDHELVHDMDLVGIGDPEEFLRRIEEHPRYEKQQAGKKNYQVL